MIEITFNDGIRVVKYVLNIEEGKLSDESIESITILYKPPEDKQGYARQQDLLPGKWIRIRFGGEVDVIITGKITDLEEDMIEIEMIEPKEKIYIDFNYKGIPKDIPIKEIEIIDKPRLVDEPILDVQRLDTIEEGKEGEESKEGKEGEKDEVNIFDEEILVKKIKDDLKEADIVGDTVIFGNILGSIEQEVEVPESERRYPLEQQTSDLFESLLSKIPNSERNYRKMNELNVIVNRFIQLRNTFFNIDDRGIVTSTIIKNNKPLAEKLIKFNKNIEWILPVVSQKKKLYSTTTDEDDDEDDSFDKYTNKKSKKEVEDDVLNEKKYYDKASEQKNDYKTNMRSISKSHTPFIMPDNDKKVIYSKEVYDNITTIIDTLGELTSYVSQYNALDKKIKNDLAKKKFVINRYNLGLKRKDIDYNKKNVLNPEDNTTSEIITQSDRAFIKGYMMLPSPYIERSIVNLPGTSIIDKTNINLSHVNYWMKLTEGRDISGISIDPSNNTLIDFFNEMKYITLNETVKSDDKEKKKEIFESFVRAFIPATEKIFSMTKSHIKNGTSYRNVLKFLERFMIYKNDITFDQYKNISDFITTNIDKLYETTKRNEDNVNKLINWNVNLERGGLILLDVLHGINDDVSPKNTIEKYGLSHDNMLDGEAMTTILKTDEGRLYMDVLSYGISNLLDNSIDDNSDELQEKINEIRSNIETQEKTLEESKNSECDIRNRIAKKYIDEGELIDDNNKEIFYDKKYDETRYDNRDEWLSMLQRNLPEGDVAEDELKQYKIQWLMNKLEESVGMKGNQAREEASVTYWKTNCSRR